VSISESHGRELDQTSAQHEQPPSAQDVVIVATSTLIDPQPWPQLADDAVNSSPSENTSPRSSLQYDGHGALFSPVAAAMSPATEYSEWLPHPAEPGTCDTSDLVVYFSRHVAPLLLFDVDGSRDRVCALLVSLADEDAPITAAICAVSSAHMQRVSSRGELVATDYHSLALSRLATLIESGCGHELALATILLLISYELLAHGSSSDMIEHHLRGAYSTLLALRGASSELLRHLECQFHCYDVLFALSFGTNPVGHTPALGSASAALPTRGSSHGSRQHIAGDLWPVLHRLATLPGLKHELARVMGRQQTSYAAVLRGEISALSLAIEAALMNWTNSLSEPDVDHESGLLLAYTHGALVYLYRHILGYPQRHRLVQTNTLAALTQCMSILSADASTPGLLWPLFTAACDSTGPERELAEETFELIKEKQHVSSAKQAMSIVKDIWKNVDENARQGLRAEDTATAWRRAEQDKQLKVILF
jgi:hypothetical protein